MATALQIPERFPFWVRCFKRTVDIMVGLVFLPLVGVLMFVNCWYFALLHNCEPALERSERMGLKRNGESQPFGFYQLRTKTWDGVETRFGRFLRQTAIDEVPQALNILIGQMSFVGPRPMPRKLHDRYAARHANYHLRNNVKPGLFGWAIAAVSNTKVMKLQIESSGIPRLEYDLLYIATWSPLVELRAICMSFWDMLHVHDPTG